MIIVKGTSYYQDNIKKIGSPTLGILTPEVDNQFDENAMAIIVDELKVGYLQKDWMYEPWGKIITQILKKHNGLVRLYKVGGFIIGIDYKRAYIGLRLVFINV